MDDRIRNLERAAAAGDSHAAARLESIRRRAGIYPPLPTVLVDAEFRRIARTSVRHVMRPNRNNQRLDRHNRGVCAESCRFCRRYGVQSKGAVREVYDWPFAKRVT